MTTRRRGDAAPSEDVQFLTSHFQDSCGPEPVDFSKLHLDLVQDGNEYAEEDGAEEEEEEEEEERFSRGRSRSRSIHEYDDNSAEFYPEESEGDGESPTEQGLGLPGEQDAAGGGVMLNSKGERTGPLQHREVAALQKGLEEATQSSMLKYHTREDEEERMAADAEKRTRMLASQSLAQSNEPTRRIKLLLLGDSGVGKSSLILRWTQDTFAPSLTSTVGVNFKSKKVTVSNELIQVQVWDTAGQEQFHKITTSYYKGAQGIMLIYDVSDQNTLENVEYWIKNIKSHASDTVQVVLVGNKIDLRHSDPLKKCVETDRGKEIALKFGVPFYEASAKDSSHVDEAFMTLVNHIAESTSPTKTIARNSLQGGLERKNMVDKLDKEKDRERDDKDDKKNEKEGKRKIFSHLLHKDKKDKEKKESKEKNAQSDPQSPQGAGPDEKCTIS